MPGAENPSDRLVVLGDRRTLEVVEPVAAEFGLHAVISETVRGAIGEIGVRGEGVVGVVIDTATRPRTSEDYPLDTLVFGLQRDFDPPIPTALVTSQHTIGINRRRYGLGVYTDRMAAMLWPPQGEEIRAWLVGAMQTSEPR